MIIDRLNEIVGDFYRSAGTSNGFHQVPPEGDMDMLLPTYWFRADFEDTRTAVSSEIMQWRHETVNDYLGSISIRHSGLVVYSALVHRNDCSDHANRQFSMGEAWVEAIEELTSRYQQSLRP